MSMVRLPLLRKPVWQAQITTAPLALILMASGPTPPTLPIMNLPLALLTVIALQLPLSMAPLSSLL